MKTTAFLLLLFFSSFTAFSQENNCVLSYRLGFNQAYWSDDVDQFVCKGGSLKITCLRVANAGYQWKKDGIIIPDANTFTYYATEEGVYTAEVQTADCKYVSPKITFNYTTQFANNGFEVNYAYGSIKTNELTICDKGESFNVNINYFSSYGEIEYQWQRDGVDIEGTNARNLLINKAGIYTVRARQGECLSHSEPLKINVKKDEKIVNPIRFSSARYSYSLTGGDTLYVCENTTIGLSSVFHFSSKYRWYKDDKQVEEANAQQFTVKESGVYNYEVSLPGGCEAKSEKVVVSFGKKINKPKIQFSKDTRGCKFDDVNISDDDFFNNYFESISGEKKMSWYKNSVYQNPYWGLPVYPNESALYKVVVDIGTCSTEDNFKVDSSIPRIVKLRNNLIKDGKITMCEGNVAALGFPTEYSSATYNYKLQWYRDGKPIDTDVFSLRVTDSGHYYATYTALDNVCMQYSDTIDVSVIKAPTLQFDKVMLSTCNYWLVAEQKNDVTYAWKKDGKITAGANKYEFFPKESGNYSFVANRGYCFYESKKDSVEVLTKTVLTEKNTFCENDTLKLKALEANDYQWKGPNNFTSNLRNPIVLLATNSSGLYKLIAFRGDCVYKDSVTIKVNASPGISIDRADEYCSERNISMIAKAQNSSFKWEAPNKFIYYTDVLNIVHATINNNGIYKVTATDFETRCSSILRTKIELKESNCKAIELEQSFKRLCRGVVNELKFLLTGDFATNETFYLYSIDYGGNKRLIDSTKTSPIKFTAYLLYERLMIESSKSKIRSNIVETHFVHTYVQVNPAATKACTGTIPMELWPSSIKYDKIQWIKDGKDIPDANGYAYYATESGNYYVKVIQNGCVSLDSLEGHVDIKIGEIEAPQINARFNSFNICDSISTHLTSYFRGIGDFQYQWQLNGKNIPGATENLYIAKQAGDYTLKISQGPCQAVSNNERLTVASPEINSSPISWTQNGVAEICEGLDFDLLNSIYSNASTKGISLQWQKDNIDIPSATSYKYKVKEAGKYRLKIVLGDCITFSNSIIVKYTRPRLVKFNIDYKEYCIGEEVTTSVWWSNDFLKDSPKAKIYRDSQLFTESGYFENFKIKEKGKYHAILNFTIPNSTKVCTAYSDTVEVVFKDKIVNYEIKDFKSAVVCADSLFISGNNWGSTYKPRHQWKFNGMDLPNAKDYLISAKQSGTYQLETQTGSGCSYLSNPIKVQFKKLYPKITKFWPICSDTSQSLRVQISTIIDNLQVSNSINVFSYDWQLNGKTIGRSTQQDVIKGGIYKVTVKNGECSGSDSIMVDTKEVKVNIPKTLIPNQDSLIVCINKYATLGAPQGDFTYTWLKDNKPFENNTTQTIKVAAVGSFKVWIEKGNCGQMSNSIALKENKERITAIISGNKELMSGDSAKIKVELTSLPPWTIKLTNNQEFITNKNPFEFSVRPLQTTVYELASVKNDCGVGTVSGTAEIKIIILGNEELAGAKIKLFPIPTQGICQLLVETVVPERLGFQLFNVEGKMLIQSEESNLGNSFKETINLESVPDGVYLLKIKVGDKIVNRKIIKGN